MNETTIQTNSFILKELEARGIPFEEIHFTDTAVSARMTDTSEGHNYNPENSIKAIIVESKSGRYQIIMRGADFIDSAKLKDLIGRWNVVQKDALENELKFVVGGICPLTTGLPSIIDSALTAIELWGMGAGDINRGLNVARDIALKNVNVFKITDIKAIPHS
jgi:prolyl-tRNA editing enzyme YbaK/EbsC (Cys-tRNA(Pro) deacylase)